MKYVVCVCVYIISRYRNVPSGVRVMTVFLLVEMTSLERDGYRFMDLQYV